MTQQVTPKEKEGKWNDSFEINWPNINAPTAILPNVPSLSEINFFLILIQERGNAGAFVTLSTLKILLGNLSTWNHHYQFRVLLQHAVSCQKPHGLSKRLGDQ